MEIPYGIQRSITNCEKQIARQRLRLSRLEARGEGTESANMLLSIMLDTQQTVSNHAAMLNQQASRDNGARSSSKGFTLAI